MSSPVAQAVDPRDGESLAVTAPKLSRFSFMAVEQRRRAIQTRGARGARGVV
jgi:hypothetical protein